MQNVTNFPPQLFKQLFPRKALLILFLVWTAVILFQTWSIQHSCNPMFGWQNTENNILKPIPIIVGTAVTVGAVVVGVNAAPAFVAGTDAAF